MLCGKEHWASLCAVWSKRFGIKVLLTSVAQSSAGFTDFDPRVGTSFLWPLYRSISGMDAIICITVVSVC